MARPDKTGRPTVADISQCYSCTHYRNGHACKAYPGGIPLDIYYNYIDHREKIDNEKFTFTPNNGRAGAANIERWKMLNPTVQQIRRKAETKLRQLIQKDGVE